MCFCLFSGWAVKVAYTESESLNLYDQIVRCGLINPHRTFVDPHSTFVDPHHESADWDN